MEKIERGTKLYLDKKESKESCLNTYTCCRDGIVEVFEYRDESGYGSKTRLFLCEDTKHETVSIVRQVFIDIADEWSEESMDFDSDSFEYLKALINGEKSKSGGRYSLVRDY